MNDQEIAYHVALLQLPGVDQTAYDRMITRWGSLTAAVAAGSDALAEELGVLPPMVEPIVRLRDAIPETRVLLEELKEHEITILIPSDPAYPPRLARHPEHPFVLFCRGDASIFQRPAISIVGTRQPSEEGQGLAFEIAAEAANRGIVTVSGFAPGIDRAAHRGALEGGGSTVVVLPHGILRLAERRSYRGLAAAVADIPEAFVAVSQFHPTAGFTAENALQRNWTIAALGDATLVVEARRSGGSHRTARDARVLGIPLFAARWLEQREQNEGNTILVRQGAIPVDASADVEEILSRMIHGR